MAASNTTVQSAPGTIDCERCQFKPDCLASGLSGMSLARFEHEVIRPRQIQRGAAMARRGDPMHSLYIPRTGSLKATITQPDGTERVLGFFSPGDTIGLAELDQKAWTHTFIALEDTWGCEIPVGALDDSLMYRIIRLMGSRLQEEYAAHQTLAMKTGPGRVASFLLQMSAQIKPREQVTRQLHLPMPYSDIADYLGMRSESLSRILNKFLKQRIILKSRRFIDLIDIDSLRQMSK